MIVALAGRILRQQRWVLCSLALGVFGIGLILVYAAAAFGPTMITMLESMPPLFRSFVGAQLEDLSMTGMVGFGFQHPGTFAMGLSFMVLVATIPAAERESGMLDLLLAHPVPRTSYLLAILFVLVLGALLIPLAGLMGVWLGLATVEAAEEPAWTRFVPSAVGLFTLLLAWGGVTLLLATFGRRRGTAVARAVGAIITLLLIETFSSLYTPLQTVTWISPFHYFKPIASAVSGFDWTGPSVLLGLFAASTALAFRRFARSDV